MIKSLQLFFVLKYISAINTANLLHYFVSQSNIALPVVDSNAVVITDFSSNLKKIAHLINSLDNAASKSLTPHIIFLKYAVASDIEPIIQSYLGQGSNSRRSLYSSTTSSSIPVNITVDSINNAFILSSLSQEKITRVTQLIKKLDNRVKDSHNNLHVVYLKNADAVHIADVLRAVVSGEENPSITASSSLAKFDHEPSSLFPSGSGGNTTPTVSANTTNNHILPGMTRHSIGNVGQDDAPKMLVQAEPTINALIIQAPDALYHKFRRIIDMLDVRRAQIMIEAMIADISNQKAGTFGIQWGTVAKTAIGGIGAIGNYASGGSSLAGLAGNAYQIYQGSATNVSIPGEMYIGLLTGGVTTIAGHVIPNLGVLADVLSTNSSVNILSRPTLITLDNEEARIMVGSNVPIPNGSYQNTATASTITNTYTRQDVGTFLDIKPLITQSGAIQLEIYQEDSQLDQGTANNPAGPTFLKRNMRTTLLVDDKQIIAIGGMTSDTISTERRGIPFLSQIPILGWLFSWHSRIHTKRNLVLFLRPVIIRSTAAYNALTNERYNYILKQQNNISASAGILPSVGPVTLSNQTPYSEDKVLDLRKQSKLYTKINKVNEKK